MSDPPPVASSTIANSPISTVEVSRTPPLPSQVGSDAQSAAPLRELLSRPVSERAREYRFRLGQSVVFGLPVVVLQFWGSGLGGREAAKWVGIFQALLAGWVVYVSAAGMLFEGILLLPRRVSADLICALIALAAYLLSSFRLVHILFGVTAARPIFHAVVLILGVWSAGRWWQYARRG
jgi:cation transport ATPase